MELIDKMVDRAIVILMGNTKGGVGKTTNAVALSADLADEGNEVLLINGDRQDHAEASIANRNADGVSTPIVAVPYPDGKILAQQVKLARKRYDYIVIDSGGRDSTSLRSALTVCDVAFIPFAPGSYECWSLADIAALVEIARESREIPLPAYTFLNCAYPRTADGASKDNMDAEEEARGQTAMEFLTAQLGRRKAFSNASGMGITVAKMKNRNYDAIKEFRALMAEFRSKAALAMSAKVEFLKQARGV